MNVQLSDLGSVIQLAIAPVFLLTGVGTMLVVHTSRLARIIDRTRILEAPAQTELSTKLRSEFEALQKRGYLINYAITLSTLCGLFVCLVIAMLFLGTTTGLPLNKYIAGCFVFAMVSLIGSLIFFLWEVLIGSKYMRTQQLISLNHRRIE